MLNMLWNVCIGWAHTTMSSTTSLGRINRASKRKITLGPSQFPPTSTLLYAFGPTPPPSLSVCTFWMTPQSSFICCNNYIYYDKMFMRRKFWLYKIIGKDLRWYWCTWQRMSSKLRHDVKKLWFHISVKNYRISSKLHRSHYVIMMYFVKFQWFPSILRAAKNGKYWWLHWLMALSGKVHIMTFESYCEITICM